MKRHLLISVFLILGMSACNKNNSSSITTNSNIIPTSSLPNEVNNNVDVIILSGQSNAEGHTWNNELTNATRYYYSDSQPTEEGNYWHYDENGEVTVWQ